jgi:hypothetical protein
LEVCRRRKLPKQFLRAQIFSRAEALRAGASSSKAFAAAVNAGFVFDLFSSVSLWLCGKYFA